MREDVSNKVIKATHWKPEVEDYYKVLTFALEDIDCKDMIDAVCSFVGRYRFTGHHCYDNCKNIFVGLALQCAEVYKDKVSNEIHLDNDDVEYLAIDLEYELGYAIFEQWLNNKAYLNF